MISLYWAWNYMGAFLIGAYQEILGDLHNLFGDTNAVHVSTDARGEVVLDCVGIESTMVTAAACARTLGDVTLVGVGGGTVPFGFFHVPLEVSLQSVYWGSRSELVEVLALAARGLLRAEATTYGLDEAIDVYRSLAAGTISGRAVIVPHATT